MNVDEHIKENIATACETTPESMNEEEIKTIDDVKEIYRELMKVPCTGCNYCMPCPFGVDIPGIFADYNSKSFFGGQMATVQYIQREVGAFGAKKSAADLCVECGKCETHCPQGIQIREELKAAHKDLDNRLLRFGVSVADRIMSRGRK